MNESVSFYPPRYDNAPSNVELHFQFNTMPRIQKNGNADFFLT